MCWSSRRPRSDVVAGDRVRDRDPALAADRGTRRRRTAPSKPSRSQASPGTEPIPWPGAIAAAPRRRTACPGARRRRGSSAGRPSSARRPRGRRPPPRRRSSGGRGRSPWACRPSARRGGSDPSTPTPTTSRSSEQLEPGWSEPSDGSALQPVALLDELAGPGDELVAGHAARSPPPDHRLAVGPGAERPRSGPAVADRLARRTG